MPAGLPLLGNGPEQLGHERPVVRTHQSLSPELGQDLRHPARGAIDLAGNGMHTLGLTGLHEQCQGHIETCASEYADDPSRRHHRPRGHLGIDEETRGPDPEVPPSVEPRQAGPTQLFSRRR